MGNTAPPPLIEYHIETECKRMFGWSATGLDSLLRELTEKGYRATRILTMQEWEHEQDWGQRRLNAEINNHIEKEAKAS